MGGIASARVPAAEVHRRNRREGTAADVEPVVADRAGVGDAAGEQRYIVRREGTAADVQAVVCGHAEEGGAAGEDQTAAPGRGKLRPVNPQAIARNRPRVAAVCAGKAQPPRCRNHYARAQAQAVVARIARERNVGVIKTVGGGAVSDDGGCSEAVL